MITMFFYIILLAAASFTHYRMKQEIKTESMLLQEIIELEQKLQNFRSQEYLLKQKQISELDYRKNKQNKFGISNYDLFIRPEKNRKIKSQINPQIIITKDSACYLEEIDKIA